MSERLFMCRSCGAQATTPDEAFNGVECCTHSQWYEMHSSFKRTRGDEVLWETLRMTTQGWSYVEAATILADEVASLREEVKHYRKDGTKDE